MKPPEKVVNSGGERDVMGEQGSAKLHQQQNHRVTNCWRTLCRMATTSFVPEKEIK